LGKISVVILDTNQNHIDLGWF